jgi:hypothetical protein
MCSAIALVIMIAVACYRRPASSPPRITAEAGTVCDVDRAVTVTRFIRRPDGTALVVTCDAGDP